MSKAEDKYIQDNKERIDNAPNPDPRAASPKLPFLKPGSAPPTAPITGRYFNALAPSPTPFASNGAKTTGAIFYFSKNLC